SSRLIRPSRGLPLFPYTTLFRSEYWHEVDFNWGARAHEFYTADATFTTSIRTRRGRDAIRQFYLDRKARGARVSLHVVNNFRVEIGRATRLNSSHVKISYAVFCL